MDGYDFGIFIGGSGGIRFGSQSQMYTKKDVSKAESDKFKSVLWKVDLGVLSEWTLIYGRRWQQWDQIH